MNKEQILANVRRAGVVGQGGAGFPTHVKLDAAVDTVIANGCECEPLLATDHRVMADHGEAVLRGLRLAMRATGAARGILAIKAKHEDLAAWFSDRLSNRPSDHSGDDAVTLHLLENFYPAGDEQVLIRETTGRYFPPLTLPKEVGCVVSNVGTLKSVAEAMDGVPVTEKTVTVTGAVKHPSVFTVPIGCSVAECIAFCGGPAIPDYVVALGGPIMGQILDTDEEIQKAAVTKTMGGIIVLPRDHYLHRTSRISVSAMRQRAAAACIQCRFCSDLCPRYLLGQPFETHRVMRAFGAGVELTHEDGKLALLCCECGVCEHVACPMILSPCAINIHLKREFARAGLNYSGGKEEMAGVAEWRDSRRVSLPRLASRAGITGYMDIHPAPCSGPVPEEVSIPLKQHIGTSSEPVCAPGDRVRTGDVLAIPPDGALGAVIHASMDGVVLSIDASVRIGRSGHG